MEKLKAAALIVDDQEEMLSFCERVLQDTVTEVKAVSSCAAAREAFRTRTFDLVLTDINIEADGDGMGLAREVKKASPRTNIIIITASPSIETAVSSFKTGAMDYIIKPFSIEYLRAVVRNSFEKARLSSELKTEKELKKELEAAYARLEAAERAKDAFLARLNRELRTPLAISLSYSELLGQQMKDGKLAELWESNDKALKQLQGVIEDMLLYSGILKGTLKMEKKPADLGGALKNTMLLLKPVYEEMGLSVEASEEGESYKVNADVKMIREVFRRLLLNAVNFNQKGGEIKIRSVYAPDRVTFSFSDTGSGVSEESMPRLFDNFFQAPEYLTRETDGLGLAAVKQIITAHNGQVAAHRNPAGNGMVFSVSLPK